MGCSGSAPKSSVPQDPKPATVDKWWIEPIGQDNRIQIQN